MTGSPGFASAERRPVVICGLNWVGDSIMAMPALQAFAASRPDAAVVAVVKPGVAALWRMHPAVAATVELGPGLNGALGAAGTLRSTGAQVAYVLPHSFRSALAPFAAGIPERIGLPGHARDFLLTRVVRPAPRQGREHQAYEYLDLLAPMADGLPAVSLTPPPDAERRAAEWMGPGRWVGLLPGAARGPSKQWPVGRFAEVGRRLVRSHADVQVVVLGARGEQGLCREVEAAIGSNRVPNLAGRTTFSEWAAALRRCAVVVANDSGGMHLSVAVGTPVVALFGITDPAKTGPLGACRILQRGGERSRDVPRDSRRAREQLAAIEPAEVEEAVESFLSRPHRRPPAGAVSP